MSLLHFTIKRGKKISDADGSRPALSGAEVHTLHWLQIIIIIIIILFGLQQMALCSPRDTVVASLYSIVWPVNHRWAMCVFTPLLSQTTVHKSTCFTLVGCRLLQCPLIVIDLFEDDLYVHTHKSLCKCAFSFLFLSSCHTWCKSKHSEKTQMSLVETIHRCTSLCLIFYCADYHLTLAIRLQWRSYWRILPLYFVFARRTYKNTFYNAKLKSGKKCKNTLFIVFHPSEKWTSRGHCNFKISLMIVPAIVCV